MWSEKGEGADQKIKKKSSSIWRYLNSKQVHFLLHVPDDLSKGLIEE